MRALNAVTRVIVNDEKYAPGGIRTPGLSLRRAARYPATLRALVFFWSDMLGYFSLNLPRSPWLLGFRAGLFVRIFTKQSKEGNPFGNSLALNNRTVFHETKSLPDDNPT